MCDRRLGSLMGVVLIQRIIQRKPDRPCQGFQRYRFLKVMPDTDVRRRIRRERLAEPGAKDDGQIRTRLERFDGQLPTRHMRHRLIGNQQIKRFRRLPERRQRVWAAAERRNVVPQTL